VRKPKQENNAFDARIALWLSRDPIGERGGRILYGMVGNNAVDEYDYLRQAPRRNRKPPSSEAVCAKKKRERARLISNIVGGTSPGAGGGCTTLTIITKLPDPYAKILDGNGLGGHTGIGIGVDFYDYGPDTDQPNGSNVFGRPGDQWWNDESFFPGYGPDDINLNDILGNLGDLAHGLDVFKIRMSVCSADADKIKQWWENIYANLGSYSVAGDQCTSCVRQGMDSAGVIDGSSALKSISFLKEMAKQTHKCGPNAGKLVEVTK